MKKNGPPDSAEIMTMRDVADYLQCHPATVRRLLKGRKIPAFRLGSEWRFSRADIDRWIAGREVRPTEAEASSKPCRRGWRQQEKVMAGPTAARVANRTRQSKTPGPASP